MPLYKDHVQNRITTTAEELTRMANALANIQKKIEDMDARRNTELNDLNKEYTRRKEKLFDQHQKARDEALRDLKKGQDAYLKLNAEMQHHVSELSQSAGFLIPETQEKVDQDVK